jgi:alkyl hydroperoxide reductase subunit D
VGVWALNGCGLCIDSHERLLLEHGVKTDVIQNAVRIAAVMKGIATVHATL